MSYSRHFDTRVQPHFTKIYTKIPYLDTEIACIDSQGLRQSRKILARTTRASDGLARTLKKSVQLESELAQSRRRRELDDSDFLNKMSASRVSTAIKDNQSWREHLSRRSDTHNRQRREQEYLDMKLADNSRRAFQRLQPVRRWY